MRLWEPLEDEASTSSDDLLGPVCDEVSGDLGLFSMDGDFLLAQENSQLYREYHGEIGFLSGVPDSKCHWTGSGGHSEDPILSGFGGGGGIHASIGFADGII
jgi:hypothetical protein